MKNELRNQIEREGYRILEEAACWVGNEGLDAHDATCEAAQTYEDLGALFTVLTAGGYLDEEGAFELITEAVERYLEEN